MQLVFSPLEFSATSFSRITEEDSNTDIQLVVGPPAQDASGAEVGMFVLFLVALLLGTCGCLWAILGFCRCLCVCLAGFLFFSWALFSSSGSPRFMVCFSNELYIYIFSTHIAGAVNNE